MSYLLIRRIAATIKDNAKAEQRTTISASPTRDNSNGFTVTFHSKQRHFSMLKCTINTKQNTNYNNNNMIYITPW